MEKVQLGRTGLYVSQLAFGTGTHGIGGRSDQSALGIGGLSNLLRFGFSIGINFWDAADEYGTHPHLAKALETVPRNEVVLLTKTMSRQPEEIRKDIHRFLEELGTDAIDILLLHAMTDPKWAEKYQVAMEVLSAAKNRGLVNCVGVSCHSLSALRAATNCDWVEVVMARINYSGKNMDGSPSDVIPVLKKIRKQGKGIIGMKVLGAGRLTNDPKMAIEHTRSLDVVHTITIGMNKREMIAENVQILTGSD